MAIERDKLQIGVTGGARTSERYRADLPDIGSSLQGFINTLAAGEREEDERALKLKADEAAKAAIGSATITKDKDGSM